MSQSPSTGLRLVWSEWRAPAGQRRPTHSVVLTQQLRARSQPGRPPRQADGDREPGLHPRVRDRGTRWRRLRAVAGEAGRITGGRRRRRGRLHRRDPHRPDGPARHRCPAALPRVAHPGRRPRGCTRRVEPDRSHVPSGRRHRGGRHSSSRPSHGWPRRAQGDGVGQPCRCASESTGSAASKSASSFGRRSGSPTGAALVEQLDLGRQHRQARPGRRTGERRDRTADPRVAPEHPVVAVDRVDHELEGPRRVRRTPAEHVVDLVREHLARRPGPQGARRVGGVQVPPGQVLLDGRDRGPQHQHVGVPVRPERPTDGQLDRPATGQPPRLADAREERRDLVRRQRIPRPQVRHAA